MLNSQTTHDVERLFDLDHATVVEDPLTAYFEAARGALSRNTERALRSDVQIFAAWCRRHVRAAFPADAATVVEFVDDMGRVKTPATVRRYVSSIATLHRALRQPSPLDSSSVRFALKRMHRRRGRRQAQVRGLTWPLRNRLLEATGDRLIDARDRALLAVGYDTLLRRTELVSLEVPDLLEEIDGSATLLVRSGKTDADGRGATLYLARRHRAARHHVARLGRRPVAGGCSGPCARTTRWARSSTRARCRASTSGWPDEPSFPTTSWRPWPGTAPASGRCRI